MALLKFGRRAKKTDQKRADKFQELSTKPWQEKSKWLENLVNHKHITWYSAKNPNGLRYEGDDKKKGKDKKGKDSS
jgi:Rieske Fe-S protein